MNVGDRIDGYEILDHIGSGGMGSVYLVQKEANCYALKTCDDKDSESIKRFQREVRLMKTTTNPNVIEVLDESLDGDDPYFVMPLCDSSLSDVVNNGLNEDEKFEYVKQFCEGIKALHDSGVIHRDIKPNNALVLNGEIKVSDLGLGKFVNRDSSTITPTEAAMGTPLYMSPEVYRDRDAKNADERNALSICQKDRTAIISIDDIIAAYKPGVNDAEFADKVYNYLFTNQDDMGTLIKDLRILKDDKFQLILKCKSKDVSNLMHLLLTTYKNDNSYWIQFEDVDVLVSRARALMQKTTVLQEKQDLLEFAINLSVEFNRWPAMQTIVSMLHDLTEEQRKSIAPFFIANKDNLNIIKDSVNNPLPDSVKVFIR
ncbi:MAG: serine/threonine protein kinase [Dysgonamonadaceae bacterium]|jgi:serine/threonine protein kinase|nr:serine/threonine protein kinase [Dysgonamonadaceae bacterium]